VRVRDANKLKPCIPIDSIALRSTDPSFVGLELQMAKTRSREDFQLPHRFISDDGTDAAVLAFRF